MQLATKSYRQIGLHNMRKQVMWMAAGHWNAIVDIECMADVDDVLNQTELDILFIVRQFSYQQLTK